MQQRLEFARQIPIPARDREQNIIRKQSGGNQRLAEIFEFVGHEPKIARYYACEHYEEQRRQDPSGTSLIEIKDRKASLLELRQNNGRNQVAADNEKDVYPYKSPAKSFEARVEQYHWKNGKSPQPVYFSSVIHGRMLALRFRAFGRSLNQGGSQAVATERG